MSERLSLNWQDVQFYVHEILRQMQQAQWMPDLIMGVDRGGLPISTMISHYLTLPHESVKVSLRDIQQTESLLWAPEDVVSGYKILIVDDITLIHIFNLLIVCKIVSRTAKKLALTPTHRLVTKS